MGKPVEEEEGKTYEQPEMATNAHKEEYHETAGSEHDVYHSPEDLKETASLSLEKPATNEEPVMQDELESVDLSNDSRGVITQPQSQPSPQAQEVTSEQATSPMSRESPHSLPQESLRSTPRESPRPTPPLAPISPQGASPIATTGTHPSSSNSPLPSPVPGISSGEPKADLEAQIAYMERQKEARHASLLFKMCLGLILFLMAFLLIFYFLFHYGYYEPTY